MMLEDEVKPVTRLMSEKALAAAKRKFERDVSLVDSLMRRCGRSPEYIDPQNADEETGADVLAVIENRRIAIQVTELDTGEKPGSARKRENKSWNRAQRGNEGTYGGWAQNDVQKLLGAVARTIASKVQDVIGCRDETWLLISASLPELGSVVSTFVVTQGLSVEALDAATSSVLTICKYSSVFLHVIAGSEDALYRWESEGTWRKCARQEPLDSKGPSFWDVRKSIQESERELLEWITDIDGKTDGEIRKCRQELRGSQP